MPLQIHDSSQTQVRNMNNISNNNSLLGRHMDERSQDSKGHRYPDRYMMNPVTRDNSNTGETMHPDDHQFSRNQSQLIP